MYKCEPCAMGKGKQKISPRATDLLNEIKATISGSILFSTLPLSRNPRILILVIKLNVFWEIKEERQQRTVPAIEAGKNDDDVTAVANKDNGNNVDDDNQNQKEYSNAIDPEVIDSDVSMSCKNVNGGDKIDQYYDTSETLDNKDMDADGNKVMLYENVFKSPSEDEANNDDTNELEHNQLAEEQTRAILGRASKPYHHNIRVGSRRMSRMDEDDVSRLLLFKTLHTPNETQSFNQMMYLEEYDLLNVSMPSWYPCGRLELQLVGAIETKFKNTKDLETKEPSQRWTYKAHWCWPQEIC